MAEGELYRSFDLDRPEDRDEMVEYVDDRFSDLIQTAEDERSMLNDISEGLEARSPEDIEEDEMYDSNDLNEEDYACPVDFENENNDDFVVDAIEEGANILVKNLDTIFRNTDVIDDLKTVQNELEWDVEALFELPYVVAAKNYAEDQGYESFKTEIESYTNKIMQENDPRKEEVVDLLETFVENDNELADKKQLELLKRNEMAPEEVESYLRDISNAEYSRQMDLRTADSGEAVEDNPAIASPDEAHEAAMKEA